MNNLGTFFWITLALTLSSKIFSRAAFRRSVGYHQPGRLGFPKKMGRNGFSPDPDVSPARDSSKYNKKYLNKHHLSVVGVRD